MRRCTLKQLFMQVYCTCIVSLKATTCSRMIECEECQKWFHFKCMGLTSESDTWVCQQCHERKQEP